MDINQVTLTGTIERDPITRAGDNGAVVSFTVRVTEGGQSGQAFKVYVPCEVYGHAPHSETPGLERMEWDTCQARFPRVVTPWDRWDTSGRLFSLLHMCTRCARGARDVFRSCT